MKFYISQVTKFVISVDHLKLFFLLCSGGTPIADRMHVWFAYSVEMWHPLWQYLIKKNCSLVSVKLQQKTYKGYTKTFFINTALYVVRIFRNRII